MDLYFCGVDGGGVCDLCGVFIRAGGGGCGAVAAGETDDFLGDYGVGGGDFCGGFDKLYYWWRGRSEKMRKILGLMMSEGVRLGDFRLGGRGLGIGGWGWGILRKAGVMIGVVLMVMMVGNSLLMMPAWADEYNRICEENVDAELKKRAGCEEKATLPSVVVNIFNWFIGVIGVVGVFTVMFAGQRMITANGDVAYIKQARSMLIYGVVGVIVSLLAFVIVNFAIGGLTR